MTTKTQTIHTLMQQLTPRIKDLPQTRRTIANNQDNGLKAATYDSPRSPSGHSDPTALTRIGTNTTRQHDAKLLALIQALANVLDDINNNDPNRTINQCTTCGTALEQRAAAFCTKCVNQQAEQAVEKALRHCDKCDKPMAKNEPLRKGLCNACRMEARRTITTQDLALDHKKVIAT